MIVYTAHKYDNKDDDDDDDDDNNNNNAGRDSSVGITTYYWLDCPEIESQWG